MNETTIVSPSIEADLPIETALLIQAERTLHPETGLSVQQSSTELVQKTSVPWLNFTGVNPLASAASPLLLLLSRVKSMAEPSNIAGFHKQTLMALEEYQRQAQLKGCSARNILAARYCLCTAIDEMVLCTPWGGQSNWEKQTLLSIVHKETWGGERFFIILEKMAEEGQENIDLLEIIYIILCLGYEGKYYNQDAMVRDEIRHRLYQMIQTHRPQACTSLSPTKPLPIKVEDHKSTKFKGHSLLIMTLGAAALLWFGFNIQTHRMAKGILAEMKQMGTKNPNTVFQQLQQSSR